MNLTVCTVCENDSVLCNPANIVYEAECKSCFVTELDENGGDDFKRDESGGDCFKFDESVCNGPNWMKM